MRNLAGDDVESLDGPRAFLDPQEAPLASQFGWLDGEVGRRHDARQHVGGITLRRHQQGDLGALAVARRKKRNAVGMVPVQMAE